MSRLPSLEFLFIPDPADSAGEWGIPKVHFITSVALVAGREMTQGPCTDGSGAQLHVNACPVALDSI